MDILSIIGLVTAVAGLSMATYIIGYINGMLKNEKDYCDLIDDYEKTIDGYYVATNNLTEENKRLKEELEELKNKKEVM